VTLLEVTYTHDAVGRILTATTTGQPEESWTYVYDDLNRLTSANNAGNAALNRTIGYDAAHNITSMTGIGSYTYPVQGASAVRPHAATGASKAGAMAGAAISGARAAGGPVSVGKTYLVGERGPELFTPVDRAGSRRTTTFAPCLRRKPSRRSRAAARRRVAAA